MTSLVRTFPCLKYAMVVRLWWRSIRPFTRAGWEHRFACEYEMRQWTDHETARTAAHLCANEQRACHGPVVFLWDDADGEAEYESLCVDAAPFFGIPVRDLSRGIPA